MELDSGEFAQRGEGAEKKNEMGHSLHDDVQESSNSWFLEQELRNQVVLFCFSRAFLKLDLALIKF